MVEEAVVEVGGEVEEAMGGGIKWGLTIWRKYLNHLHPTRRHLRNGYFFSNY